MQKFWHDRELLLAELEKYSSFKECADAHGIADSTIGRAARKFGIKTKSKFARGNSGSDSRVGVGSGPTRGERPGATITDSEAVLIGRPNPMGTDTLTPEDLFRAHNLNPDDWEYTVTLNRWDALTGEMGVTTLAQLKVSARRKTKLDPVLLHIQPSWHPPKPRKQRTKADQPEYVFVFPDPHAPDYEKDLYDASLYMLDKYKPKTIICLGDAADNSPFKKHAKNPRTDHSVTDMQTSTYNLLAGWRNAAPNAEMHLLPGNHDWWLKQRVLESLPAAWELKDPTTGSRLLSLEKVLALDSLHIKLHDRGGEYHDNVFSIAPDLVAMHGTLTGKHGGSAKEHERWEGASNIQGHDHKTAMFTFTKRLPGGGETQRYSFSAGTMSKRDLGYSPAHNCNQSFMIFRLYTDGRWHPEFALYDPQRRDTTLGDYRYRP